MDNTEIQNLIKSLVERTAINVRDVAILEDGGTTWFKVEVTEPHYFLAREGEGLLALNHLVRRIVEGKTPSLRPESEHSPFAGGEKSISIDINDFQKKRIENVKAIAHMMAERARYFKSSVEIDPMSPYERRIVHEFLALAPDLKTESQGVGRGRRVVIKYVGGI